ncbi:MAG: dynamin family protein [Paracoccaceae bacterium]
MKDELTPTQRTDIRATDLPSNLKSGLEPLADLSRKMAVLDEALNALAGLGNENTDRAVSRLRKSLSEFEPSVTLLGQVKAGKTALVNALAGWSDLLPSDVNPWTSVVTSLHLVPGSQPVETGARFQFMTEDEWDRLLDKGGRIGELADRAGAESELQKIRQQVLDMREKSRKRLGRKFELLLGQCHEYSYFDKNMVERYICLGDDFNDAPTGDVSDEQGRFADITKTADLYLNSKALPTRLCLRDTPGVNDTFMMREQITIQAVRDSKTCVVVLSAHQALTSVDMGLIRLISNLEGRDVIIFVNRIDELADPAREIPEIEASIQQTLRDHQGPEDAQIVFGSAYWANKALSGGLNEMPQASADALLSWAAVRLGAGSGNLPAADMVWELSGLPALYRALSERIAEDIGARHIAKVAGSAVTLAGSLQAAEAVTISGGEGAGKMNMYEIRTELNEIAKYHLHNLKSDFDKLIQEHHNRADRVHANFIQRATHSLIEHLEQHGEDEVWEYSPTGLRMLLRSAYNVFGSRAQVAARQSYEAAIGDLAMLYARAFGPAVEGIEISIPSAPEVPAPVVLGQAIALDFRDGWWTSWWRRTRGYKAFAKRFQSLIGAETEDFMTQLKTVQTSEIRDQAISTLKEFLEEQSDVLSSLGSTASARGGDVQELFYGASETQRRKTLQSTLDTLSRYAA